MILNGTDLRVYVNETLVAFARNNTLNVVSEFLPISGQGNGFWKENLPSILSWSVNVDLLVDLTEDTGLPSMFELISERTIFRLKIQADADDYYYSGMAYLSTLEVSAPNEDVTTLNVEVMPDGILERIPVDQINFTITETGITYGALLRLSPDNILAVSGQGSNIWALYQNGRQIFTKTMSDDIQAICWVGNKLLITTAVVGGNNYLFDSNGNLLLRYSSATSSTTSDLFAYFYQNSVWTTKSTQYVKKYINFDESQETFDLGSGDSLSYITVNKYGAFVINETDASIQKIGLTGAVTIFLDVASTDYVMLASDDDYLFVARVLAGNLSVLCYLDSTLKWTYSVGTYSACSMVTDKDRNLYICVSDSVIKLNNLIVESTYLIVDVWSPEKTNPKDIQVSPTGTIILASGQSVSGITYQQ
jgi:hypothetical protein